MNVITLTLNPALDKSAKVDGISPEDKLKCHTIEYHPGGGGINISRVLKRLGIDSDCVYPAGGDSGHLLSDLLHKEQVHHHAIPVAAFTRENFAVYDTKSNLQYRFGMPGNSISLEELAQIETFIQQNLKDGDILVLSGSLTDNLPSDYYSQLLRKLNQKNIKVVLDTSGKSLKNSLSEKLFLIKPNELELTQLAGKQNLTQEELEDFAMQLVNSGKVENVVVSRGADGAMIACKSGVFYQKNPKVTVKTTIGAGDSMVAGLIYGAINNFDAANMLKWGVACGSAATINFGSGLAQKTDIDFLLKSLS